MQTSPELVEILFHPLALAFREPYHWSGRVDLGAINLLVEVHTDAGIAGYKECIATPPGPSLPGLA
jgi:L-alanine-DL-glutamate epimerase-like enolase superfamily enzyme